MQDRSRLIDQSKTGEVFAELRAMLAALVSQNLLEPTLDHRNKGESTSHFNLNRLLCAHFDLPLGYGGWRRKTLKELTDWMSLAKTAIAEKPLVLSLRERCDGIRTSFAMGTSSIRSGLRI